MKQYLGGEKEHDDRSDNDKTLACILIPAEMCIFGAASAERVPAASK